MKILFSLLAFLTSILCQGQNINNQQSEINVLLVLNQKLDNAVVAMDTVFLKNYYADDFVFSHGSGKVEGREGWLVSVNKGNFLERTHDSVFVELHPQIAILKGSMHIKKQNKTKVDSYHLKYIRVYQYRKFKWVLISHSTISEYHDA